jgi:hypothetical protein
MGLKAENRRGTIRTSALEDWRRTCVRGSCLPLTRKGLIASVLAGVSLVFLTISLALSAPGGELLFGDESLDFCKRIAGPDTVCTFSEEMWKNVIHMHALEDVSEIYVKDIVPAEFDVRVIRYTHGTVVVTPLGQGEMGATMIEWWIDGLQADEQAMLIFAAATRENPAGRQEFTSPGTYAVNPGYDIHWTYHGMRYESRSGARTIVAIDCGGEY